LGWAKACLEEGRRVVGEEMVAAVEMVAMAEGGLGIWKAPRKPEINLLCPVAMRIAGRDSLAFRMGHWCAPE
jgi:hypothetical protein